ncbi:helix-turn-helix domain-containing protein [Algicola sagamiensis]|uniref:helix-turn-helix domain-containing protein n=1 Tax=Algicola sagamiensis TaxID=163869 RepID=UPI000374EDD5|nr:helix-turn-helix transcriptional regulator [Algicola sagamiensis]
MKSGELLRFYRTYLGFTQKEVAERYGVTERTYRRWENSVTQPGHDDIKGVIEGVFGITVESAIEAYKYVEHQTVAA